MIRARSFAIHAAFFLAVTGLILISSFGLNTSQLTTTWENKYTTFKDDLRTLAVDPLDPRVIYIGTDQAVLSSSDGGETWTVRQSFRENQIDLSGIVSEEALRFILLIEETGGEEVVTRETAIVSEEDILEEDQQKETVAEAKAGLTAAQEAAIAADRQLMDLESQLSQAQSALSRTQSTLASARLKLEAWTPDSLSPSEVESLPYESDGWMESSSYDELGGWLSERGLPVSTDPHDRQKTLIDYLKKHESEGEVFKAAVVAAEAEASSSQVDSLSTQVDSARAAKQQAEVAQVSAEKTLADKEAVLSDLAEAAVGVGPEATPALAEEFVSGVTYIEIDPSNPDTIFLSTFNGVYKSADKGETWSLVYRGLNPSQSATLCLAIDPSNPDAVFAGTVSGLTRSIDGGKTWERPPGRVSDKVITALAVHPFDSQVVLAGTEGKGAFKSTDGGSTWRQCFSKASRAANSVHALKFALSQPQMIYAGTGSGVFKSADGGESWDTASGMGLGIAQVRDLLVSPINPEIVYLATRRGVFGTVDGGGQWRKLTFGLNFRGSNFLAFDPLNPSLVWLITDSRVFQSAVPAFLDLSSGEKVIVTGSCEITLDGRKRHSIVIDDVDEETGIVKIEIQSETQSIELKAGESKKIDLDEDGIDDLVVTLDGISKGVPQFTMEKIPIVTIPGEVEKLKPVEEVTCLEDLEPYFRAEPSWVEVQQAAARWAEVHPDKIAAWRRGSSFRAFLPEVTFQFSLDRSWSTDIDREDEYGFEEEVKYKTKREWYDKDQEGNFFKTQYTGGIWVFEDAESLEEESKSIDIDSEEYGEEYSEKHSLDTGYGYKRGRDLALKLEWELGDFLYDRDQLRISKEARDLVELRQDVLEQVTLYFFDRRNAWIDMIFNPPADPYSRVEMLLRLQQLNASLDALTGGYFTRTIKERERQFPPPPLPEAPLISVSMIRAY